VVTVLLTAGWPKLQANTSLWPETMVRVPQSRALYEWMRDGGIPKRSAVMRVGGNSVFLCGYDMSVRGALAAASFSADAEPLDAVAHAQAHGIDYLVIGLSSMEDPTVHPPRPAHPPEAIFAAATTLARHPALTVVRATDTEMLFRVARATPGG
jgi:hypothetical protein